MPPLAEAGSVVRCPAVKICGITAPDLAILAADLRVDMLGLVFASSRRQVGLETARSIRRALDQREDDSGERPLVVGVFVNEPPYRVLGTAREVGLDVLQLSGEESVEDAARCAEHYPVLKAFRFPAQVGPEEALEMLGRYDVQNLGHRVRPLVDAYRPGEYGGTGQLADWSLAAALAAHHEIILAGGLTPANMAQAVSSVLPWGVDVSSGVEQDGTKEPDLMEQFVRVARTCTTTGAAIAY